MTVAGKDLDTDGLEITFASSLANIDRVTGEVLSYCQARIANIDEFALKLVLYEALANAVRHGNGCDPTKHVRANINARGCALHITVCDEGDGFARDGDHFELPDRLNTGGRGLFLLNSFCDEIEHNEQGNEIRLIMRPARSQE